MARPLPKTTSILLSKRAYVFYLEHARVMVKNDTVVYLTTGPGDEDYGFNIPDKNTSLLLLGQGTSVTDGAARKLAESGVMIGFCGSSGAPLLSAVDHVFLEPHSEYRPTEYMQAWCGLWLDDEKRSAAARLFLVERARATMETWSGDKSLESAGVRLTGDHLTAFEQDLDMCRSTTDLLAAEGRWAKQLYKILSHRFGVQFIRAAGEKTGDVLLDRINGFIDHGNYLAYGYAAVALHALGIAFSMPLLHGKTRRGGLVFDVADLIKDRFVLPQAFVLGTERASSREFRAEMIRRLTKVGAVDIMIDTLKNTILKLASDKPL